VFDAVGVVTEDTNENEFGDASTGLQDEPAFEVAFNSIDSTRTKRGAFSHVRSPLGRDLVGRACTPAGAQKLAYRIRTSSVFRRESRTTEDSELIVSGCGKRFILAVLKGRIMDTQP